MPTGQIAPINVDPSTGAALLPGMVVDDDFNVNRLSSYIATQGGGDPTTLTVSGGLLTNNTGGYVAPRNQRLYRNARSLIGILPGASATWQIRLYPKYINDQNLIYCIAHSGSPGTLQVAQRIAGVDTVLGSTLPAPSAPGGAPWWFVMRQYENNLVVDVYQMPPYLSSATKMGTQIFPLNPVTQGPGYGAILLNSGQDWAVTEWVIVDETNRQFF